MDFVWGILFILLAQFIRIERRKNLKNIEDLEKRLREIEVRLVVRIEDRLTSVESDISSLEKLQTQNSTKIMDAK